MQICTGWARKPLNLSRGFQYHPEQLMNRVMPSDALPVSPLVTRPAWILLEGQFVKLDSPEEVALACKLACICHNDMQAPFWGEEEPEPTPPASESEETEEGELDEYYS